MLKITHKIYIIPNGYRNRFSFEKAVWPSVPASNGNQTTSSVVNRERSCLKMSTVLSTKKGMSLRRVNDSSERHKLLHVEIP